MLQAEATATHGEAGVLRFALHRSCEDPRDLIMIEVYRTEADVEHHAHQPYFRELVERIPELFDGRPTADRFERVPCGESPKGRLA